MQSGAGWFQIVKPKVAEIVPGFGVSRLIPQSGRRRVGPWCFLDVMDSTEPMSVAPHPHCGIETVTWLFEGEAVHSDSIGSVQKLLPGQLNIMTSGRGVTHQEVSPNLDGRFFGLQFWVLLPKDEMSGDPDFQHQLELPEQEVGAVMFRPVIGDFGIISSPASSRSPSAAVELRTLHHAAVDIPLRPDWEYAILPVEGYVQIDGVAVAAGEMAYLESAHGELGIELADGTRALLFGGEPYLDPYTMWWNFVGRSGAEIAEARRAWAMHEERFGDVRGTDLARIEAPEIVLTPK